jgi:hypothetical protein
MSGAESAFISEVVCRLIGQAHSTAQFVRVAGVGVHSERRDRLQIGYRLRGRVLDLVM